jgi:gliding motility-associated-like protein
MKLNTNPNQVSFRKWMFFVVVLLVSSATSLAQLTVTKTYVAPSSVTIDGCGIYCATLPGVTFSAADFTNGYCQIVDVDVSITWAKTDGTCMSPATGSSFHNETSFRIDGPTGNNVILVQPNSYTGNGSTSTTTTVLDQAAATVIGGVDPVSGTFRPNNGDLNTYNGTSAHGTWFLRAGDLGGGDPLCMVGYSVTITVAPDNTLPVPNVASLPDVIDLCSVTSLTAPTATDNCSGTLTGTPNVTLPITTPGTTVVTWTYTDDNGNSVTQPQNVIIADNIPPVPNAASLADITDQCAVTSLTSPTATDNCVGAVTVTNNATLPITAQGTTVVTWTYTDAGGNASTQTQNVIIDDNTPPVPTLASLADVTSECSVATLTAPTATDNCAGLVTVTNNATLPITTQGTTVVTWTYTDVAGNATTQVQNVVIDDITSPVPTLATLADITAECSVTTLTPPTATDNCAGVVTVTNNATLPITAQGTTVITWTYTDVNGNSSTQTQNVIIDDITAPVPTVATLADVNSACAVTSLTAPTATDNCLAVVTVTNNAVLPITAQGTTVVTWTYSDGNGNTSTQTQNVIVTDNIPPVPDVASLANVLGECSVTSLTAPTATDNCGGAVTVTNNATLPITTQGTTVVTWTYTDGAGNSSTQTQNVILNDLTAPVPDVVALADAVAECFVTVSAPTATDNCVGTVVGTTVNPLTYSAEGVYVITWTFTDVNGNSSTQTQNVIIDDVTPPVPTTATLADVTAECGVYSLTYPTASDNCGGTITGVTATVFPITTAGTTVVTWTFDDNRGNVITQTQNVIIDDITAPVPSALTLPNVTAECEVPGLPIPTATDNCNGLIIGTTTTTFPITTQGTTVVTWTFDDGDGNVSTQTQTVVINDIISPVADIAALPTVNASCSLNSLTPPTASDNCGGTIVGTTSTIFPITTLGTTTVIWSYADGNGNFSTQTQTVLIDDNAAPVADVANLPEINGECVVTTLTPPTATDNCAGVIVGYHDAVLPITLQGTTVVTWTYDDGNGNISTQVQSVVIDDITAPTPDAISLPDVTAQCQVTSLTAPTATDNCSGFVDVQHNLNLPITTPGTYTITWTFTDARGNVSAQTQTLILDNSGSAIVDPATIQPITADCEIVALTPPTATDACGGTLSVSHDATLPLTTPGNYVINWTFTDQYGGTTVVAQNATVNLTEACLDLAVINDVITPNADGVNDTWELEDVGYFAGCTVKIFNRWGAQVYETVSYDNSWNAVSDKDETLPAGVYYYIIYCNDDEVTFKGYITVVR